VDKKATPINYTKVSLSNMSWKGVHVQDYKFDYVDETEFIDNSIWTKLSYAAVFLFTLQGILQFIKMS
jgi:hypothetical protein